MIVETLIIPANQAWQSALIATHRGHMCCPRGLLTREVIGRKTVVSANYPIVSVPERKLNYKFMAAEAIWILRGSNRVDEIYPWCKKMAEFSDDGYVFQGAYGPKVSEQMHYVIETLCQDQDTRQAVINIWREMPRESLDVPCTLSMQFILRDGILHMVVSMRSSDVWLGLPYDLFNFSMILHRVSHRLREDEGISTMPGNIHITAGSQHLYERDLEGAQACIRSEAGMGPSIHFQSAGHQELWLSDMREGK